MSPPRSFLLCPVAAAVVTICFLLAKHATAFSFVHASLATAAPTTTATKASKAPHDHEHRELFRLVDHVDQLKQVRQGNDGVPFLLPPPHLFTLPAPGGNICLVIDEKGCYHAVRDAFPPLGLPVSESGIVDTEVNVIEDMLLGTRFHLSDGSVRGRWCPGGTAGPVLVVARVFNALQTQMRMRIPFRRRAANDKGPRRVGGSRTLEVFAVTTQPDGSVTVALPLSSLGEGGRRDAAADLPQGSAGPQTWAANCGLAGYDH